MSMLHEEDVKRIVNSGLELDGVRERARALWTMHQIERKMREQRDRDMVLWLRTRSWERTRQVIRHQDRIMVLRWVLATLGVGIPVMIAVYMVLGR